jgi:hypothetical protein
VKTGIWRLWAEPAGGRFADCGICAGSEEGRRSSRHSHAKEMCDAEGEVGVVNGPVGDEDEERVLVSGGSGDGEDAAMLPVGGGAAAEDEAGELVGGQLAGKEEKKKEKAERKAAKKEEKRVAKRVAEEAATAEAAKVVKKKKKTASGPAILMPLSSHVLAAACAANESSDNGGGDGDEEYEPKPTSTAAKRSTLAGLRKDVGAMEGMMEVAAVGLPGAVAELHERAQTDDSLIVAANAVSSIFSVVEELDRASMSIVALFMDELSKAYNPERVNLKPPSSERNEAVTMSEKRAEIRRLELEIAKDVAVTAAKRKETEDRKKNAALLGMEQAKAEVIRQGKKNRSVASVFGSPASSK